MEEVGEIQTYSFYLWSFLDAVKYHCFTALKKSLERVVIWFFVGPEASDILEGLLEGLRDFIEQHVPMLDLEQFDAFQPYFSREVQPRPRQLLIVKKGEVIEKRLKVILLALLEQIMSPHACISWCADKTSDSTAA